MASDWIENPATGERIAFVSETPELLRGPLPVGDIARRVGYRQSAQFAKAFRAHHGMVPSAYRERVRGRF